MNSGEGRSLDRSAHAWNFGSANASIICYRPRRSAPRRADPLVLVQRNQRHCCRRFHGNRGRNHRYQCRAWSAGPGRTFFKFPAAGSKAVSRASLPAAATPDGLIRHRRGRLPGRLASLRAELENHPHRNLAISYLTIAGPPWKIESGPLSDESQRRQSGRRQQRPEWLGDRRDIRIARYEHQRRRHDRPPQACYGWHFRKLRWCLGRRTILSNLVLPVAMKWRYAQGSVLFSSVTGLP